MSIAPSGAETTRVRALLIAGSVGLALGWVLDPVFYRCRALAVFDHDAYWAFRVVGSVVPWVFAALAIGRIDPHRARWNRSLVLLAAIAVALAATIALKIAVRRLRPEFPPPHYTYEWFRHRPWRDRPLYSGGLSFPSEHASTAFAGALVLGFFYPRAAWVWIAWAAGCAVTRVVSRAHYFSDIAGSLVVAVVSSTWTYRAARSRGWLDAVAPSSAVGSTGAPPATPVAQLGARGAAGTPS